MLLLKHGLSDPKDVNRIISLLKKLRSRNDLFAKVGEEIDVLLQESFSTTNDAENILHSSSTFTSFQKDRKRSDANTETKKTTSKDDFVTKFLLHFYGLQSLYKRLDETDKFEENVMTVMGCFVIYLWGWFLISEVNDLLAFFLGILSFSFFILGIARSIVIMNFGGLTKFTPGVIYGGFSFGSFVIWLFFLNNSLSFLLASLSSIVLIVSSVVVLRLYRDRFFQK